MLQFEIASEPLYLLASEALASWPDVCFAWNTAWIGEEDALKIRLRSSRGMLPR